MSEGKLFHIHAQAPGKVRLQTLESRLSCRWCTYNMERFTCWHSKQTIGIRGLKDGGQPLVALPAAHQARVTSVTRCKR